MQAGDKVKYTNPETGRTKTGLVHGVRKAADSNGKEHIISYLIDTGEMQEHDQPELVDVRPIDVQAA